MVPGNNVTDRPHGPDIYAQIALRLADQGWCVTPDFLTPRLVGELRGEAERIWNAGGFHHAGVGRAADLHINPEARTDHVRWLDPQAGSDAQRVYLQALEELRQAINRELYLGLFEFEGHLAIYPPAAITAPRSVPRHRAAHRELHSVPPGTGSEDGGSCASTPDTEEPSHYEEILPLGDAGHFQRPFREVLPARRQRISIPAGSGSAAG
jgi:SM-20-related protein